MPTGVQGLPGELLAAVLGYLLKPDLKEARLTCVRWSHVGAETLLQRVYFAPRKDVMQKFTDITSHPVFGKSIREIIYDGRLFQALYLDTNRFKRLYTFRRATGAGNEDPSGPAWNETLGDLTEMQLSVVDPEVDRQCSDALNEYKRLFAEQEAILGQGHNFETLCNGLKRMPNIEKVSVQDLFLNADFLPLFNDSHQWYHDKTRESLPLAALPSGWEEWAHLEPNYTPEHLDWDYRGIRHLFQAASKYCLSIKELQVGSSRANAQMKLFHPSSGIAAYIDVVAGGLKYLKLDCGIQRQVNDNGMHEELAGFARLLLNAGSLEVLSISTIALNRNWIHLIQDPVWPKLKVLDLGNVNFTIDDLLAIIEGPQLTLKKLQLRNVWLKGLTSWQVAADKLGELLKLNFVALAGLVGDEFYSYPNIDRGEPSPEETLELAKRMMAWAEPWMLELNDSEGPISTYSNPIMGYSAIVLEFHPPSLHY